MRVRRNSSGYTVIEVLLFLAISGFMFAVAAVFISGKQADSEFRQGMNDINSQVTDVINSVSNGFYPSNGDFSCNASSGAPTVTPLTGGTTQDQGSNKGCVFMGKIIQFGTPDSSGAKDGSQFRVYSVVGRQSTDDSGTNAPATFVDAKPAIIKDPSHITEDSRINWGIRVVKAFEGDPSNQIAGVGFFGSFKSGDTSDSGSQSVISIPFKRSADAGVQGTADELADAAGVLNASAMDSSLSNDPNPDITLCLEGPGKHYGTLHIGDENGQRLTTRIRLGNSLSDLGCE
jgi:hypothetical protein